MRLNKKHTHQDNEDYTSSGWQDSRGLLEQGN